MTERPVLRHPRMQGPAFESARLALGALSRVSPDAAAAVALRLFTRPVRHDPRPWELELLRTATPLAPAISGLHAVQWGPADGPIVLLVHGWEGRGSQMAALAAPLVAAGRRVIALDAPAHGRSVGRVADPLVFAKALLAMQAHIGPLHAVVGHSLGGASAVIAWSRGLEVGSLVLLGSPSRLSRVVRGFPTMLGLSRRAGEAFVRRVERRAGMPLTAADPLTLAASVPERPRPALLIVHDPADAEVPLSDAEALAATWPGAVLRTPDAGGHRRMLRHPDVIHAVADFLR